MAQTPAEDPNPELRKPFSELTEQEKLKERFEFAAGQPARAEESGKPVGGALDDDEE